MNQGVLLEVGRHGVEVAIMVCLPVLCVSLFVGLAVSVFQAITQVQEMTLTFVPKLLGVALVLAMMGSWMLTTLVQFMTQCFQRIGHLAG